MKKRILSMLITVLILLTFTPNYALAGTNDYPYANQHYGRYWDEDIDPWNFYYRECTSFVAWRLNSRNGVSFTNQYGGASAWGDATTWGTVAKGLGITVNNTPAVGSVAWWGSGDGHVAWVEAVNGNNVTIEEYNYDWSGNYNERTISASNPTGYIHIQDMKSQTPVDIGTNFYAVIVNVKAWKHLHYEENGNVDLRFAQNSTRQIWKFERQSDLSYKIISTYDGKLLDVDGAGKTKGTNVQTFVDHNHAAQQWFFYGSSGHYYMRAKHSDLYLDLNGNNSADGTNIQMWEYNGGDAQIFQVYHTDMNKPTLTVTAGTSNTNTHLSWSSALGTNVYNARIKQGEDDYSVWNITDTECDKKLSPGNYKAYIDACNATSVRASNEVYFTVEEDPSPTIAPMLFDIKYNNGYADVTNTSNKEQTVTVIIAEYENQLLQSINSTDFTFAAGEKRTILTGNGQYKIFVWDSLKGMRPLSNSPV